MRVPDRNLAEVWDQGFTIVENFLDAETLAAAREAMWEIYPKPDDYFRAPEEHSKLVSSQFGGLRVFPYKSWAKYSGAVNYDQFHHRDFGNHSLVVPRADRQHTQMTTFMLLSDVTAED